MMPAVYRARLLCALAFGLLVESPVAQAATLTITLKSGQVVTYNMNDVKTVVYSDSAAGTATPAPAAQRNWAGQWRTTENSIGILTLTQQGNVVTGTYPWKSGRVTGTVSGNEFVGEWTQSNGKGGFKLTLSADGKSLKGTWSYAGSNTWNSFSGTRP